MSRMDGLWLGLLHVLHKYVWLVCGLRLNHVGVFS